MPVINLHKLFEDMYTVTDDWAYGHRSPVTVGTNLNFLRYTKNKNNNEGFEYIVRHGFEMRPILCLILSSKLHVPLETFM